jgi:hypothetical protein
MFEFGLTASVLIVAVFLGSLLWKDLAYLGAFVSGFVLLALGIVTVNFYVDVVPASPGSSIGMARHPRVCCQLGDRILCSRSGSVDLSADSRSF